MPVQKISKGLLAAMLLLILGLFVANAFSVAGAAIAVLLLLGLVALWQGIPRLPVKTVKIAAAVLLVLYAILLLAAGFLLAVEPAWDFGRVYAGALDIAENGAVTYTLEYFLESNNNFFVTYLLAYWFKIASVFGLAPLYAGILLNCVAIWVSVAVLFWVVCKEWDLHHGLLFLVFCLGFLPLYTYAPIFYTDTLSLPFVSIGVWLWQKIREKSNLGWLLLLGVNGFVGYQLKASVGILYVAMLLFSLARPTRAKCLRLLIVALTMVLLAVGYSGLLKATKVIDLTEIDRYRLPYEHYVMMGLAGTGGYNSSDHELSTSIEDLQTRKETNVAEIKARLADYGVGGYLAFLAGKIEYTWLDGTYYAPWKLSIDPLQTNDLSAFFRIDGQHYNVYNTLAQGGQIAMLLLMLFAALWYTAQSLPSFVASLLQKKKTQAAAISTAATSEQATVMPHKLRFGVVTSGEALIGLLALSVFGLFFFLLIWETRSRYLVNFTPVFLLLAQNGLAQIRLPRRQVAPQAQKQSEPV
ncbi:MAG: glycosyltransferase family 39 protein [Faecalibacterium sp.]